MLSTIKLKFWYKLLKLQEANLSLKINVEYVLL